MWFRSRALGRSEIWDSLVITPSPQLCDFQTLFWIFLAFSAIKVQPNVLPKTGESQMLLSVLLLKVVSLINLHTFEIVRTMNSCEDTASQTRFRVACSVYSLTAETLCFSGTGIPYVVQSLANDAQKLTQVL